MLELDEKILHLLHGNNDKPGLFQRIAGILSMFPEGHKRAGLIPILDLAQRQHGIFST